MSSHVFHEIYLHFNWHTKLDIQIDSNAAEGRPTVLLSKLVAKQVPAEAGKMNIVTMLTSSDQRSIPNL